MVWSAVPLVFYYLGMKEQELHRLWYQNLQLNLTSLQVKTPKNSLIVIKKTHMKAIASTAAAVPARLMWFFLYFNAIRFRDLFNQQP